MVIKNTENLKNEYSNRSLNRVITKNNEQSNFTPNLLNDKESRISNYFENMKRGVEIGGNKEKAS